MEMNRMNSNDVSHANKVSRQPIVVRYDKLSNTVPGDTDSCLEFVLENVQRTNDEPSMSTLSQTSLLSIPPPSFPSPFLPPPFLPLPPPSSSLVPAPPPLPSNCAKPVPVVYKPLEISISLLKTIVLQSINKPPKKIKIPTGMSIPVGLKRLTRGANSSEERSPTDDRATEFYISNNLSANRFNMYS